MSRFNLNDNQEELLRTLVEFAKQDKLLDDKLVEMPAPDKYGGFIGAISTTDGVFRFKMSDLKALCRTDPPLATLDGGRYSITKAGYGAIESNFTSPVWLTKQAPKEVQIHIPGVVQTIKEWIPKQRFQYEEAYEAALAEYLVAQGIPAAEQQGMSLTDILAAHGIGVEIKLNPDRGEYDRLAGQIMRQLEEFGVVVVLIVRPDKRDLLDEYKSRFAGDDRVIFIIK